MVAKIAARILHSETRYLRVGRYTHPPTLWFSVLKNVYL